MECGTSNSMSLSNIFLKIIENGLCILNVNVDKYSHLIEVEVDCTRNANKNVNIYICCI